MESESKLSIPELDPQSSAGSFAIKQKQESEVVRPSSSEFPTWSSRIKCLLAYMSLTANFTSVLRFSHSLGIFGFPVLVPYIVFVVVFGMPVVLMEVMLGRYVAGNFIHIYSLCPFYKGILACQFVVTLLVIISKFCVCIHLLKYLSSLFRGNLPWADCGKPWANMNCHRLKDNNLVLLKCLQQYSSEVCSKIAWETSGTQYWEKVIINSEEPSAVGFSVLYLCLVFIVVTILSYKGIRSLEKSLLIFIVTFVVLVTIVNLMTFLTPGSLFGFREIWSMSASILEEPPMWLTCLNDIVFTLHLGQFALPFISSHGKFTDDIYYDALTIVSSVLFSFTLAIPVISIIERANENNPLFKDEFDVYIWISEAFVFYVKPKPLWPFFFYLGMLVAEISSQAILCSSIFEASFHLFKERFSFTYTLIMLQLAMFLLTIPFIFFPRFLVLAVSNISLLVVFLELITLQVFYGIRKFSDDYQFMMGYHPSFLSSTLICATILSFVFVAMELFVISPKIPQRHGFYIFLGITAALYIIIVILETSRAAKNGTLQQIITGNPEWGPLNSLLKKSRILFDSKTVTKEYMYRKELYKKLSMKPNDFADQNIVHLK